MADSDTDSQSKLSKRVQVGSNATGKARNKLLYTVPWRAGRTFAGAKARPLTPLAAGGGSFSSFGEGSSEFRVPLDVCRT